MNLIKLMTLNTYLQIKHYITRPTINSLIISAVFFSILITWFNVRNKYYVPSFLELTFAQNTSGKISFSWDSGSGFNRYEILHKTLKEDKKVRFMFPQTEIRNIKIEGITSENIKLKSALIRYQTKTISLPTPIENTDNDLLFANLDLSDRIAPVRLLSNLRLILAAICTFLLFSFLKFAYSLRQSDLKSGLKIIFLQKDNRKFWILFVLSFFVFFMFLLGIWPGAMTVDSAVSWAQTQTLGFHDYHPYLFKLYVLALKQFYDSPATICLFQGIYTAALSTYILYYCWRHNVHFLWILLSYTIFICSVPIIFTVNWMVKDIPFSLSMWGMAFLIFYHTFESHKAKSRISFRCPLIWFALLTAILCQIRHNGVIYYVIIPLLLLPSIRWKDLLIKVFPVIIVVFVTCRHYLPETIGVKLKSTSMAKTNTGGLNSTLKARTAYTVPPGMTKANTPLKDTILHNFHIYIGNQVQNFLRCTGLSTNVIIYYNGVPHGGWTAPYRKVYGFIQIPYAPKLQFMKNISDWIVSRTSRYNGLVSPRVFFWNLFIPFLILVFVFIKYSPFSPISLYAAVFLLSAAALFLHSNYRMWRYYYYIYLGAVFTLPLLLAYLKHQKNSLSVQNKDKEP